MPRGPRSGSPVPPQPGHIGHGLRAGSEQVLPLPVPQFLRGEKYNSVPAGAAPLELPGGSLLEPLWESGKAGTDALLFPRGIFPTVSALTSNCSSLPSEPQAPARPGGRGWGVRGARGREPRVP